MASAVGTVKVKVVPDVDDFLKELQHAVPSSVVMQIMRHAAQDLIFQYSEWLDAQGHKRSHDQLARDFLAKD